MKLEPEDWQYLNEGGANVVFKYCGTDSELVRAIEINRFILIFQDGKTVES